MRLAGFVIHGNNKDTLGACLESLTAVCDEVLALDSQSTDGSRELALAHGVRSESRPWRGFGAARAEATRLLGAADYIFYLDSDEWLEQPAREVILRWKQSAPTLPYYRLVRRDWVFDGRERVLYRREHKRRLIRRDHACWHDTQLVHETLGGGAHGDLNAYLEHAFVTSVASLGGKTREYALLWALQQRSAASWAPAWLVRAAHMIRDGVVKGAFFRGGRRAWQVARVVADYHVWKYRYLRAVRAGRFADEQRLLRNGDLAALLDRVRISVAER